MTQKYSDEYKSYLAYQSAMSRKTAKRTERFRQYPRILKLLNYHFPDARSILLIGCRHVREYEIFSEKYEDVTAIDLFDEGPIINCDMSRIPEHEIVGKRSYDVFVSIRSFAHCVDDEGFISSLKSHANMGFYCFTKAGYTPDSWYCSKSELLKLEASPKLFIQRFSPLSLRHLTYVKDEEEFNIEFICKK